MNEQTAANYIRERTTQQPKIAVVTGSGLGALADALAGATTIPFATIPDFPRTSVEGHAGEFRIGSLRGKPLCILRGRVHFYEGYTPQQATFYVRVLRALGIETLVLTNAAGGLNPQFAAGDIMLINDHINMVAMAGFNPLYGPNDAARGPRFPAMNPAYDPQLRRLAKTVAAELGINLREGVYAGVAGPSFETAAELRALRVLGGDAVGMSTANETIAAVHGGLKVLGLSLISNMATGEPVEEGFTPSELHQEVLTASAQAAPRMLKLIEAVIARL